MSKNSKGIKKFLLILTASVSLIILVYCIIELTLYDKSAKRTRDEVQRLKEKTEQSSSPSSSVPLTGSPKNNNPDKQETKSGDISILPKYRSLYDENPDFAGWVTIEGTKVDYPVMQTVSDEEYYLHRNFEGEESNEGLPFIDARCDLARPSTNIIIYGHNMKNGDVFADLLKYKDKDYYNEHGTVKFDSVYYQNEYKVISVFSVDVSDEDDDDFDFYNFINNNSVYPLSTYLSEIKAHSMYEIPFDEDKVIELLTLVTCEYTKKDGRMVIISAKMSDI